MLMRERHPSLDLADAAGFMLIETLVAIISATVVTGALFMILIVSLHQTSRITGRVQATELGRDTMTHIVDELHSACIAKEFVPIQEKSGPTELIFISGIGEEAVLKKASLHKIVYSKTEGTLVETTTPSSGGEWPNFEYKGTPTTTRIGRYISAPIIENAKKEREELPVFKYYKYAETSSSTGAVSTLSSKTLSTPLNETEAKEAAAVDIDFTAGAYEGKQYDPEIELTDQATFAFTAPSAETPIVQKPCE